MFVRLVPFNFCIKTTNYEQRTQPAAVSGWMDAGCRMRPDPRMRRMQLSAAKRKYKTLNSTAGATNPQPRGQILLHATHSAAPGNLMCRSCAQDTHCPPSGFGWAGQTSPDTDPTIAWLQIWVTFWQPTTVNRKCRKFGLKITFMCAQQLPGVKFYELDYDYDYGRAIMKKLP